jgi:hypothetical protein
MGEEMFKDLALSRDMVLDYHSKLPQDSSTRKLSAMVLQRSAWPFNVQKTTIDIPPDVRLFYLFASVICLLKAIALCMVDASRSHRVR